MSDRTVNQDYYLKDILRNAEMYGVESEGLKEILEKRKLEKQEERRGVGVAIIALILCALVVWQLIRQKAKEEAEIKWMQDKEEAARRQSEEEVGRNLVESTHEDPANRLNEPTCNKDIRILTNNCTGGKGIIDHIEASRMTGDIVIPESMNEIRWRLFEGNKRITSVTIPGTVKRIGMRAFAECENLKTVILNEGIEEIESNVFSGCHKLREVTYPDSVRKYQGRTFYKTNLIAPVLNVSGTILVFCPPAVSGREWHVPDSVKIISWQAFVEHRDLEMLYLPDGLEKIEKMAFISCGIREITIPPSVREIGEEAFRQCGQLEKVTILNPDTKLCFGAFSGCSKLREINYANLTENDRIFHLKGLPFLTQHLETQANLDHRNNSEFQRLTSRCAEGDADAMYDLAEWFEQWSCKPGASLFYIRASNYWRYRAYCKRNQQAVDWFTRFFRQHPGEHLQSILYENSNHSTGYYSHSIPGDMLNDLGFSFFDPERQYEIKQFEGERVVEVSAFESYEGPDEDGFGAEYYYDWWFLDENLQPIPGVNKVIATVMGTDNRHFQEERSKAEEILMRRNNS